MAAASRPRAASIPYTSARTQPRPCWKSAPSSSRRRGPLVSLKRNPLTLTQADGWLEAVLDLMSEDTQAILGTNEQELTGHWRTTTNPPTHVLATAVEACGRILAIRSYSAKNEGAGTILAVLTDHLPEFPPSFVEMIDSSGKLAQRLP